MCVQKTMSQLLFKRQYKINKKNCFVHFHPYLLCGNGFPGILM